MKITTTAISKIQGARLYIYEAKNAKRFYKKSQTLFKKQDNLRYTFYRKSKTLYVTKCFMKFLKLAFIQKA